MAEEVLGVCVWVFGFPHKTLRNKIFAIAILWVLLYTHTHTLWKEYHTMRPGGHAMQCNATIH